MTKNIKLKLSTSTNMPIFSPNRVLWDEICFLKIHIVVDFYLKKEKIMVEKMAGFFLNNNLIRKSFSIEYF